MELDEQERRGRDDPQQRIAVVGAEDGIGGDAGRIVVRKPGQQPRSKHCQERSNGSEASITEA
jgi:hypothetical protein